MKIFFSILFSICLIPIGWTQDETTVHGELLIRLEQGYHAEKLVVEVHTEYGLLPQFCIKECISDYMRIWLFSFDENAISKEEMLRIVRTMHGVEVAQVNHKLEERIVPDDPFLGQQWHHIQSADHDIDTDLAWDITTGGLTAAGDEIVVCVVELGGATWDITELIDNHWVNELEIPSNGIDDDANGYVDDYDGWNVSSSGDNISNGDHGTRVSSMVGAKGNNTTGIVGVNWDVKLMQVEIGSVTEAGAIAGYLYPMKMRKLYNETNGQQGAYVVATNTSWGTSGQPSDAPLWCAMYDSLGVYGVLSCGATTNSNDNIDITSDLPTGCPSEYLISVGRTNNQDVRASGGYGQTTIDLMAPGDAVYLANNTSYGTTTGTSFSSPCVAGSIALLYSAPCNSFMQIANADPAEGAGLIRDYILDGVDQTNQLIPETVSGGRLNVNNSLVLLMNECDNSSCIPPFSIADLQQVATLNYEITWQILAGMELFSVQYRPVGSADWTTLADISTNSILLPGLEACTEYELQVMTACGMENSNWSAMYTWTTDGCCINPDSFVQLGTTSNSATIQWNEVLAAESYNVVFTPAIGDPILYNEIDTNPYEFLGLNLCEEYVVSYYSNCNVDPLAANDFTIHTTGCENCTDLTYCDVSAGSGAEYIQQVTVGDIDRVSASDGGYILVNDATTTLSALSTYTITCTPGYSGNVYNENFKAWIDYNSDGDFEEVDELIFDAPLSTTAATSGEFIVPAFVQDGIVRLRVAMRYTTISNAVEPEDCGTWTYGEIEDYCVLLDHNVSVTEKILQPRIILFPNPTDDILYIKNSTGSNTNNLNIQIFGMDGKLVFAENNIKNNSLNLSKLSAGMYTIIVRDDENVSVQKLIRN